MFKYAPLLLAAAAAAAPSLPDTCTNLPAGFCSGAMVPNVAYSVPAMYGCKGVCKEMNIWCQANKKGTEYEFLYCCGDNCEGFPKEKTCTVEGKNYTVGQAYEVTLKNSKDCVTLWCISEDEYRTCKGEECGCKPELTPPPPQVCKDPTPCGNQCPPVPPKPQPPKPQPPVHKCRSDRDCYSGYYCAAGLCQPLIPGPLGQCIYDSDCKNQKGCGFETELGCVCDNGKCAPVFVPGPDVGQCIVDWDCKYQRGCELGCVCSLARCIPSEGFFDAVVPGEEGPFPDNMPAVCTSDADCAIFGLPCVNGSCGPVASEGEGPFPDPMPAL